MTFGATVPSYAAASRTEYISEIVIESSDSGANGEARLRNAGYKVLGATIGNAYVGYKTTTDPTKAITDIKLMNMNGKYSYSDYEVILKKQKAAIEESLNAIAKLIEEFRTNYKANKLTALHCYEILNKFFNDDAGMYMGDFLLECSIEPNKRNELSDVFMQGNGEIVLAIQQALALGSDTSDTTFIDRLQELDYDSMLDAYAEEYGSRKDAIINLALDYDDEATKLLEAWNDFYFYLRKTGNDNMILMAETDEEIKSLGKEYDEGEIANGFVDAFIYDYLDSVPYGDGTMLDYFLRNIEDIDIEEVYPFIASLSDGQRANIESISIYTLVEKAIMDKVADENTKKAFSDVIKEMPTASVFSGVDRRMFTGGVALTSEATSADSRSSSGGWQKPFEAAEKYYWAIALITVVSFGTYIVTTAKLNNIILNMPKVEQKVTQEMTILIFNETRAHQLYAKNVGNFITRRFNYGAGIRKVSTSLVNLHRVSFVLSIVAIFANVAMLSYELYKLARDEEIEYINIPSRMVNYISDDSAGHYIKYECANDLAGRCADINEFSEKEWLAMYYSFDQQAGKPIKASSLEVLAKNTVPSNKKPVTLFNEGAMYNCSAYTGASAAYLAFEQESASLAGSAFSGATYAIIFGVSLVAAFAISFVVVTMVRKEKKCKKEADQ